MASLNPNSPPYFVTTLQFSPPLPPLPQVYYYYYYRHFPWFHAHHPSFSYYVSPFCIHRPSHPKHSVVAPKLSTARSVESEAEAQSAAAPTANGAPASADGAAGGSQCYWRAKKAASAAPPPYRRRLRATRDKQRTVLPPACSVDFKFREEEVTNGGGGGGKTTVMIKNIPNWFDKRKVLELLDKHCLKENHELEQHDGNTTTITSEFDFLYLPMDFRSGSNLGYGFVNFTTPVAACRLFHELNQKSWDSHSPGSRKVCEVTYARIQGLHALLSHFRGSTFACGSADYLPVHFTPGRDGLRSTNQHVVGKHAPK